MNAPEDESPPPGSPVRDPLEDAPTAGLLQVPRAGQPPRIRSGLVLSERYMVMRFLAQGGMGEIYEVEDLQLGERVALKTIRAGLADDPQALERFKREIQLARRVTHENVCRIFEFGVHRGRDGVTIAFLTMELLPGETLLDKLRRDGRMAAAEALPLVRQMVAALESAHRAGVVHRDFKSANVLLVPSAGGPPRAVVTDFGLARLAALEKPRAGAREEVSGTLDYMPPEQIAGQEPTPAVDVYALGVVIYEMVTAFRPFGGGPQDSEIGLRHRDQAPPSPRTHVPDLDPAWERVILRCLAEDPKQRFHEVREVARALSGEPARGQRRLLQAAVGGGLALALALGFGAPRLLWTPPLPTPRAAPQRRAVAVLPFKNLAQRLEAAWLSPALAEMLTTELAAGQHLRTIPGEDVARMRVELAVPEADTFSKDTLARIHANLGTDLVASGSYLASPSQLRVDVRVQDARAGETLATVTETGAHDGVVNIVERAGSRLRRELGLSGLSAVQTEQLRAALPSSPEAARLYSAGLAELRRFDALAARELLTRAVAADPRYPLAHAALAESLARLGHEDDARKQAQVAFAESAELPREERLLVEARYREMSREWSRAVEIHRVLFGFFPDNLEHGLKLVEALNTSGKPGEATDTLAALRRLPAPIGTDPRIDMAEAAVAQSLGDFRRQRDAALRAAAQGRKLGATLMVARAQVLHAYAAGRLGLESDAEAAAEEARRLYEHAGDQGGVAWALNRSAAVHYQQGRMLDALGTWRQAERIFRQIGYEGSLPALWNNISEALYARGELAEATRYLERAHARLGTSPEPRAETVFLLNLANAAAAGGQFAVAERGYAQALELCRKLGDQSLLGSVAWHRADGLFDAGRLAEAKAEYTTAVAILDRQGNTRYAASARAGLGRVLREEAGRDAARAAHAEALGLRQRTGDAIGMAESRLALAQLELEEGRTASARQLIGEALPTFAAQQIDDGAALAHALLAAAEDAGGSPDAARRSIAAAQALAQRSERPRVQFEVELCAARLGTARGERARAQAGDVLARAQRLGYAGVVLEARLALGVLAAAEGRREEAGTQLEAVAAEAGARGFTRLQRAAQQAGAARGRAAR